MGDKLFAVPWSALTLDEDEKCFILDVDKETLESAPGFDEDNWPDMAEPGWRSEIYSYYQIEPYWQEEEEEDIRASRGQKTFRGGGV